jgi:chromosome segregation ATPase
MDNSSEIDRLAAENASLAYELGVKSTESDERAAHVMSLQSKLDVANTRLLAIDQSSNDTNTASEVEISLRAENDVLKTNLAQLEKDYESLEQCKSDLELAIEEQRKDSERMLVEISELKNKTSYMDHLENEVAELKETIITKDEKLQEMASANEELHKEIMATNNRQLADSRDEVSISQSQFDEFRQHHNNTMEYMEEQMSGLMQQNSQLNSQLENRSSELERLQQEISELMRTKSENESKYAQQVFKLEGENLELSAALNLVQSNGETTPDNLRVQELENERTQLSVMLDQHRSEMNTQRQAFDDLSEEYEEARLAFERVQVSFLLYDIVTICNPVTNTLIIVALKMEHGNVLARNRALEQDNKSLEFQLNETSTKSNHLAAANRALEQDIKSLEFQLNETSTKHEKLQADMASLQVQLEEQEKEAFHAIAQWEALCVSLEKSSKDNSNQLEIEQLQQETSFLTGQVVDLTSQLNSLQSSLNSTSSEKERLIARVAELEEELKDENVTELRDELTSLHEERQQLDLDNEELLVQLGLMQQSKIEHDEEMRDELTRLRGQVATLEDNIAHLQMELSEARCSNVSNDNDGLSTVVEKLHKENVDLQSNISRLSSEKDSLENDINNLAKTVKSLEHDLTGRESKDAEVQRLKDQVNELETHRSIQQQATAEVEGLKAHVHELEMKLRQKEQDAQSAAAQMKHTLERKDDDILKLTTEGYLRETTLKEMERHVQAKNIVDSMQVNLNEDYDIQQEEEKDHDDNDSLQDLLADELESDDYLRNQIVILAQALERAELQRADVLDRLTRERKSNADSLKQLGESVKRFYSTVRCSDTV